MDTQLNDNQSRENQNPHEEQLKNYILQQLQSGVQPNEISGQLRQVGWTEEVIQNAFKLAQSQVMPTNMNVGEATAQQPTQNDTASMPGGFVSSQLPSQQMTISGKKRGRIKVGWLLFKQSIKVLKTNKNLIRYILMSMLFSFILLIVFAVVFILGRNSLLVKTTAYTATGYTTKYNLSALGYIPAFIYYVLAFFIVNIYTAGLAANVLDLFQGNKKTYKDYMKKAWSKASTIFVFSLIEATIGLILRIIAERSALLGRIVAWILGALWSLARLFVIPIIVTSDENAFQAIKDSTKLLVSTWGENIVGRVSMGGVLFLFYLLIMIPAIFIIIFLSVALGGLIGFLVAIFLVVISVLIYSIVSYTATNVLNTALFYYAQYKQIPAAFDADLLNSVFILKKKRKGLFRKQQA